jgi:hypothetical protein
LPVLAAVYILDLGKVPYSALARRVAAATSPGWGSCVVKVCNLRNPSELHDRSIARVAKVEEEESLGLKEVKL